MGGPFSGIGIVFDIGDLGGGFYGYEAWRIFMTHLDPSKLTGCTLKEGDTKETLRGDANEFCIVVYGKTVDMDQIKKVFVGLEEKGLAAKNRRFIEKPQLDSERFIVRGRIDSSGMFVTESWNRIDHDLSKEAGWRYKPKSIPKLHAGLKRELKKLMEPKIK